MAEAGAFAAPKLGIGMIFSTALLPFLRRRPGALDVLELEPQTMWLADDAFAGPFHEFTPGVEAYAALPGHKLVHSVGIPLGGTRAPEPAQLALLKRTADRLNSPWVSEHLSVAGTPHRAAGFLLPPLQTDEGVETAARNIRAFAEAIGRPVAIETGVAYLKRKPFEMEDGDFVARVAEAADCGILLDIHNVYCNARNGRIDMDRYLSQLPLGRVWEVHLAGGEERQGYYLDSHSGAMNDELAVKSREIVQSLPNLGALNFEVYDTFLERMAQADLDRTVDQMRAIWEEAGRARADTPPPGRAPAPDAHPVTPKDWEEALTDAVWKADAALHPYAEDEAPVTLYGWLARSFRGSMLTRAMPRTIRYLLLRDGEAAREMLERYFSAEPPRLYTPLEVACFHGWLSARDEDPVLKALLDYDLAFMKLVREGTSQIVTFPGNPGPLFEALAERRLPAPPAPPEWEIELLPDIFSVEDFEGVALGS